MITKVILYFIFLAFVSSVAVFTWISKINKGNE